VKPRDIAELLLLAAIWGASFLFMRVAVPSFGPVPLAAMRLAGAALMLLPLILMRQGGWHELKRHARPIAVVGILGSAMPFLMYGVAAQALNAGVMSIMNATTPMWGAIFVWMWLGDKFNGMRMAGLALGFAGVAWLAWDSASIKSDSLTVSPILAVAACLVATLGYGFVAVYTKKKLVGVTPMVVAAGSQIFGALILAVPAALSWPQQSPSASAWWSTLALATLCTGLAYLLYFRLIAHVGAANATTVTFLIPLFAVLWGTLVLAEPITTAMVIACILILLGTGLTTGVLRTSSR
jgi:drug/metabolite transporter (DMT)-like permease